MEWYYAEYSYESFPTKGKSDLFKITVLDILQKTVFNALFYGLCIAGIPYLANWGQDSLGLWSEDGCHSRSQWRWLVVSHGETATHLKSRKVDLPLDWKKWWVWSHDVSVSLWILVVLWAPFSRVGRAITIFIHATRDSRRCLRDRQQNH